MNIFQFNDDYFSNDFDDKNSLAKMEFWSWMLEKQAQKGFHLLPPFINYICNTNEEPPTILVLDENQENDDDGDGIIE